MVQAIVLWEDAAMDGVSARIIVRDDLERSRLTVFFRLLLGIPHVVWLLIRTVAAVIVAVANWVATLVLGRPPEALSQFLASYVRYAVHVNAYVTLAADPFPAFTGDADYPIDVELGPVEAQGRLSTLFRIVLALPALVLAEVFLGWGAEIASGRSGGAYARETLHVGIAGGVLWIVAFLGWFACLARGRMPRGFRNALAYSIGYVAQVAAYVFLLSERYPNSDPQAVSDFDAAPPHPVRLAVDDDLRRSRVTVFFRLLLFVPHYVWLALWGIAIAVAVVFNWFATLALGRSPAILFRFISAYVRYQVHAYSFVGLVANPFPGFVGRPGSYPVDLHVDGPDRQHRLRTLFRIFLAVPALLVNTALSVLFFVVGVLGWFAALATGRMPRGYRNVGAWAVRYGAQVNAFLYLLTDRYPYSGPEEHVAEPEAEPEPEPLPA
jgi:uncharacterized protein DUF4389